MKRNTYQWKRRLGAWSTSFIRTIFFLGIGFYILYPLFTKVMMAFMAQEDIYEATVSLVPKHWTTENIKLVFEVMNFPKAFLNSLILSLTVTLLQLLSALLVGYGFGRFDFPFKKLLFALGIFMLIVPPSTLILPLQLNYSSFDVLGIFQLLTGGKLNLLNTFYPFVLSSLFCTGMKGMMFVFMFRQYFRNMPKEIEEAAYVDGAGEFRVFWNIMAPSSKPIIVCVTLLSFVWQWTDVLYSGWYMSSYQLLSINLYALTENVKPYIVEGGATTIGPALAALLNGTGVILLILPLLVLYLFMQKNFIQSVERSGIVG